MQGKLTIAGPPEVAPWMLKPDDAAKVSRWCRHPITIEYWPRERIAEAWARDSGTDPRAASRQILDFRGYSYANATYGEVAVVVVDQREDYLSATFVALHELAHLHLPPWSPPNASNDQQIDREEARADAVAARLMGQLLGYEEKVYEARGPDGRKANPPVPLCPAWVRKALQ